MNSVQEIHLLLRFLNKLKKTRNTFGLDPRDGVMFDDVYPKLIQLIPQLSKLKDNTLKKLKQDITDQLNRAVFVFFLKGASRYLKTPAGDNKSDFVSQAWTLEYFRIEPVLPKLTQLIRGRTILDPFAGSGNDMLLVAAACSPKNIVCSDLCYAGGMYVPGTEMYYDPKRNREEIEKIYENLPDWCNPHLSRIMTKYTYANAKNLPFPQNTFDWIVTHPPFGINLQPGGADYFLSLLPQLMQVVAQGIVFSSPTDWKKEFKKRNISVLDLTGDVTKSKSKYPSCFLLIKK